MTSASAAAEADAYCATAIREAVVALQGAVERARNRRLVVWVSAVRDNQATPSIINAIDVRSIEAHVQRVSEL